MDFLSSEIASKLMMMQLGDSFFPSGSFTLSHGLEFLVRENDGFGDRELKIFLQLLLRNKLATCDLVASTHAYRGSQNNDLNLVRQADERLFIQTPTAITRTTQIQSGRALLMVAQSTWQDERLTILAGDFAAHKFHCLQPIVFGVVGNIAGLTETDTILAFLHGFVTGLLGAAIRLNAIGHLAAQQILLQLAPDIEMAVATRANLALDEMYSATPAIDLAQMRHSKLNSKLFAN